MKKIIIQSVLCILLIYTVSVPVFAETVYLYDGQILNGKILEENDQEIKIKTKYQEKTIQKKYIQRILYSESVLQPVRIVTKEGELIEGYLVYQDADKAVYKKTKTSAEEISLSKDKIKSLTIGKLHSESVNILTGENKIVKGSLVYQDSKKIILSTGDGEESKQTITRGNIKRITYDEILVYDSELLLFVGLGMPFNTGGAKLGLAPAFFAGYLSNLSLIKNTKLFFEAGYSRFTNSDNKSVSLQVIPASINLMYTFKFKYVNALPKLGAGASVMYYRDADGNTFLGTKPMLTPGVGASYTLQGFPVRFRGFLNYNLIYDSGKIFGNLFFTVGAGYRI